MRLIGGLVLWRFLPLVSALVPVAAVEVPAAGVSAVGFLRGEFCVVTRLFFALTPLRGLRATLFLAGAFSATFLLPAVLAEAVLLPEVTAVWIVSSGVSWLTSSVGAAFMIPTAR